MTKPLYTRELNGNNLNLSLEGFLEYSAQTSTSVGLIATPGSDTGRATANIFLLENSTQFPGRFSTSTICVNNEKQSETNPGSRNFEVEAGNKTIGLVENTTGECFFGEFAQPVSYNLQPQAGNGFLEAGVSYTLQASQSTVEASYSGFEVVVNSVSEDQANTQPTAAGLIRTGGVDSAPTALSGVGLLLLLTGTLLYYRH